MDAQSTQYTSLHIGHLGLVADILYLDNQVFSNLLIFILHLIAKINDLRGVDVKTVRIHQKTWLSSLWDRIDSGNW